ncbi:MAG: DUF427 domain-containing protein [Alphaproteobacteria bacterium]
MPARTLNQLPPPAWQKNTGYVIDLEPLPFRVRAEVDGATVLDSNHVLVMYELGHAPVYYVPSDDLSQALLTESDHSTYCPYKGDASYWSLTVDGRLVENVVWAYLDPYPEMASLVELRGIYWDRMDAWFHDGTQASEPLEIPGRINEHNNFAAYHPALAKEWHRERNDGIRPYEFSPDDVSPLWWVNADGEEWQASIMDRVQGARRA